MSGGGPYAAFQPAIRNDRRAVDEAGVTREKEQDEVGDLERCGGARLAASVDLKAS